MVDVAPVRIEGVAPTRSALEDVVAPYELYTGKTEAQDCTTAGSIGYLDLVLQFDAAAVAAAIEPVEDGDVFALRLTGEFVVDGVGHDFVGEDVVVIVHKRR